MIAAAVAAAALYGAPAFHGMAVEWLVAGCIFAVFGLIALSMALKMKENIQDFNRMGMEEEERLRKEDERLRVQDERDKIGQDEQTNPLLKILVVAVEKDGADVAEDARYLRELEKHGRRRSKD